MSPAPRRVLRSLLNRFRDQPLEDTSEASSMLQDNDLEFVNPVDAFYLDKAHNNLKVLYRFAIQSRSLAIRDVFAKAASKRNIGLNDLLVEIKYILACELSDSHRKTLANTFRSSLLLALADLLTNTARSDLDTNNAIEIYNFVQEVYGVDEFSEQQALLHIEALSEVGLHEQAIQLAEQHAAINNAPLQKQLIKLQQVRFTHSFPVAWIRALNEIYAKAGLTQVRLLNDDSVSYLDRLAAESVKTRVGPKVSVIVPTYSPTEGIYTAIRGLIQQTWQNLEIIIVDDASPSEYQNIFVELPRLDPRIQVIHLESNSGAYVARNAGLAVATGQFITTTDDDDWSHPDKIASQVSVLIDDPSVMATTSAHIRTTENLELRRVNSSARYLQMNYSSLMFRKEVIDEVGPWDTVNRGADSEFFMRLNAYYGSEKVTHLHNVPLSFSRVWEGSLTSGEMYRGFIGTPRVLYLWAIRQWHWDQNKIGEKPHRRSNESRPYAVPSSFEAGKRNTNLGLFDVVYAADFFRQAKHVGYVLDEIRTLVEKGLRVGYMHLDSPRTTVPAGFPKELFEFQLDNRLTQVSLNDKAETKLLIVYDSAVGMFMDQNVAGLVSRQSIAVERELPKLAGAPERWATHFSKALHNLDETFGTRFRAVGATEADHRRLRSHLPESRVLSNEFIWRPHVRVRQAQIKPPRSSKPVVGFHSYGNKYRWPRNRSVFESVYVSESFETRFYGQVEPAIKSFGRDAFESVKLVTTESTSLSEFLDGIDFWVYYPHPKLEDNVWEPALFALLAGKVLVLPPRLSHIYGDAAIYASSEQVGSVVSAYSREPKDYIQQGHRAQAFIASKFSDEHLLRRVKNLVTSKDSRG